MVGSLLAWCYELDPDPVRFREYRKQVPSELLESVEQGAATSVLLAASPLLDGVGGRYFVDCNETETETETVDRRTGTLHGVARYALDPTNAQRLWALFEALLANSQGAA
ncbi:MAG: short-chain dehydrogenase/reductase [Dactylosporangium sp.]|nr:short-chain dehydrogenase/reductase [Dactylosporangium sp.]